MRGFTAFGAAMSVAILALAMPQGARADDPNDPAMRNRAAREADRAIIKRLNEDQLAYVRQRDAGYAEGWRAYDDARGDGPAYARESESYRGRLSSYQSDQQAYADAQRQYQRDMAAWRERVSDCRAGYYEACR